MQLNLILSLTRSHSSPGFSLAHCIRMIRCSHLKHQNIFPLSCGIFQKAIKFPGSLCGAGLRGSCDHYVVEILYIQTRLTSAVNMQSLSRDKWGLREYYDMENKWLF